MAVLGPFHAVVAHLSLDHAGGGVQPAVVDQLIVDLGHDFGQGGSQGPVAVPSPERTLRRAACNALVKLTLSGSTPRSPAALAINARMA